MYPATISRQPAHIFPGSQGCIVIQGFVDAMVYGKLFPSCCIRYYCRCANATKDSTNARGTAGRTIYLTGNVDSQFEEEEEAHGTLGDIFYERDSRKDAGPVRTVFWSDRSRTERSGAEPYERRERKKEGEKKGRRRKEEQSEDELCNRRPG